MKILIAFLSLIMALYLLSVGRNLEALFVAGVNLVYQVSTYQKK